LRPNAQFYIYAFMRVDLDLIQGTWAVAELEMEGQTISGGMLSNARVEVTGNRFSSLGMGAVYEGTLTLDDSANPHQLDMKFDAGPEKGNTNLGIYELDRGRTQSGLQPVDPCLTVIVLGKQLAHVTIDALQFHPHGRFF